VSANILTFAGSSATRVIGVVHHLTRGPADRHSSPGKHFSGVVAPVIDDTPADAQYGAPAVAPFLPPTASSGKGYGPGKG